MILSPVIQDLVDECEALREFLAGLAPDDWHRQTLFFDWTVADEVMHLHLIDWFGMASLETPEHFPELVAEVRAGQARGYELSNRMRDQYGHLPSPELLAIWTDTWRAMIGIFAASDLERRIPWFGPEMSVASFAAARQMEVWAHGQDIYDVMRVRRTNHDRIRNICDLGVRTQGWSFRNRGLDKPSPPEVRLTAPSGREWVWSEGAAESIVGPAEDFALVVTQRRHVDDTGLRVMGADARRWMEIAQCFAGAAETGPAPGVRAIDYTG
ncbi:TIGR03084 family metal-binding protein [Sphingosinicella sp. LHD-64]|uniref:TIGR03084 family metal-binding protein n=1 Tax=Sphingosinicella sp. LHD-64 TaxID=3072139 RepID=UPI00280F127E|nr:TIGR03084 family metal-binding protein [Sphingosinicella sp. LHD-64]MDQ8757605.1 TIGR03084 family metal-binding protein [Sphingosinicella sp. LHD-64]